MRQPLATPTAGIGNEVQIGIPDRVLLVPIDRAVAVVGGGVIVVWRIRAAPSLVSSPRTVLRSREPGRTSEIDGRRDQSFSD